MDTEGTIFPISEDDFPIYFSEWLKRRRQELDLTQAQLAKRVSCTVFTIRKIEAGERRPSRQLAGLLAQSLEIPSEDQTTFIKVARGELGVERLPSPAHKTSRDSPLAIKSGSIAGNMPKALTPFIGREPELAALSQLLYDPQCSLITLVGSGGIGKTRLAIEAAQQSQALFPDGTWFVPLASMNSPVQIVPAIAGALDFKFQEPTNPQGQLLRYLRSKRILLVLDNAEHLLDGVGVFTEILKDCPQVKLLVTSRERLNLLSEWVFDLQGLPLPPNDQVEQFEAYSSVALFLQSARRVRTGFMIRADEKRYVLNICQTMEGMPLGIELSAAWVGLLSCEEIAKEIEHNIDFLSVSMRDLPERHRSLRATLDHSWKLLNTEEKLILSRLSVFHGSFSREAAQDICGVGIAVLSSLKNKNLLYRTDQDYYSLHEIVRQYAGHKLAEHPDENERVKDQHALYYVQRLSEWEKALKSSRQVETFDQMAQVIDNLSQGWQHMLTTCRSRSGKRNEFCADLIPNSLFSLNLFYEMRCRSWEAITLFTESVECLKTVQGEFEETEDSSWFNSVLGHITAYLGLHHIYVLQYENARKHLDEALLLLAESLSRVEKAQAQLMLAEIEHRQGQLKRSAILHEQARGVFREAGESWWYLLSLINLAWTYLPLGKLQECDALYQEGFRLIQPGDLRLELSLRMGFAYARYLQNDYARAEQLMHDNLELSYQFGNHRVTANIYVHLSQVALSTNRVELAEQYLQEGVNLLSEFGQSDDLPIGLLYLGKCFFVRLDLEAARQKFRQVIKIGHALNTFYLVYWGLVNIARTYMNEGYTEKALEIALVLKDCSVEQKTVQDEGNCLLADLQAVLPEGVIQDAVKQIEDEIPADQARAHVLAFAWEFEHE
jgi:predicted ATPase/transcriptional regulator with XRE-family HTH domain